MLNKKYIIKAGADHFGRDFYGYSDIQWATTDDINRARVIDKLSTAKSNATRLRNNLLRWAREDHHNDPRPYEPIEVVEIDLTVGQVVQTKPSIVPEV